MLQPFPHRLALTLSDHDSCDENEAFVIYLCERELRTEDNFGLIAAAQTAAESDKQLVIIYRLDHQFLWWWTLVLEWKKQAIQHFFLHCESLWYPCLLIESDDELLTLAHKHGWQTFYTDFSPLKNHRQRLTLLQNNIQNCRLFVYDSHNLLLVEQVSDKQEYGARTIRPKIHKLLPTLNHTIRYTLPAAHKSAQELLKEKPVWETQTKNFDGGLQTLKDFCEQKLCTYNEYRNDPCLRQTSGLSPFLHYGTISPFRIYDTVLKYKEEEPVGTDAFLEEFIIRRELSENFCWYNEQYDSFAWIPDWAQKTLEKHKNDTREYCYSPQIFESGMTHDPLWNAAQKELVNTGSMHWYMRMYWAKKILEWSPSPESAFQTAITLNNRYQIDGRDPNGYVWVLWSIGGLHDRPWPERPIYGTVRSMTRGWCDKKFDTKRYIRENSETLFGNGANE